MKEIQYELTELNRMIAFLENQVDKESEEYKIFRSYMQLQKKRFIEEAADKGRPFLSIITRTQGKRPDMLTETMLCLTGQTDTDFEFIVVGHNLNDTQNASVNELIGELPDWMQQKTVFLPVEGGTRTTPLIKGFEAAKGKYIAVLDDDDLVFDNWVASFKKAYENEPGKILHSYTLFQDWETVSSDLPNTPISVQTPSSVFCRDFSISDELTVNSCPLLTLAFPSYAFNIFNIRFDETLTTTEDWDFLMRTAFVTGVANIPVSTCIYRNWLNTENSQTLHSKSEWNTNYHKIVERFKSTPAMYDRHSIETRINSSALPCLEKPVNQMNNKAQMYYDVGDGFSEANIVKTSASAEKEWTNCFVNLAELGEFSAIRIDPDYTGNIALKDFKMRIDFDDGSQQVYDSGNIITNAYKFNDLLVFLKNDPQLIVCFDKPKLVNKVECSLEMLSPVPDAVIEHLVTHRPFIYRILRKIWRMLKGALGK